MPSGRRPMHERLLPLGSRRRQVVKSLLRQGSGAFRLLRALPGAITCRDNAFGIRWYAGPVNGRSLAYRVTEYAGALESLGLRCSVCRPGDPSLLWKDGCPRAAIVFRAEWTDHLSRFVAWHRTHGVPVYMDMDDLLFDRSSVVSQLPWLSSWEDRHREGFLRQVDGFRRTLEQCDGLIATTDALLRAAPLRADQHAILLPNAMPIEFYGDLPAPSRPVAADRVLVGYFSGSATHDRDWAMAEEALGSVMGEMDVVDLLIVGPLRSRLESIHPGRVIRRDLMPFADMARLLAGIDVNLCTLEIGNPFCEAKSGIKVTEAAAFGRPSVASHTATMARTIRHGIDGMLADSPEAWRSALRALCGDEALRARMGREAQRRMMVDYHPQTLARGLCSHLGIHLPDHPKAVG